jgi:pimeloyl-ACP methyl ester carboxylesterase
MFRRTLNGGTTGLQLAMRHPERVRTLVAVSPNSRSDGYYPELLARGRALPSPRASGPLLMQVLRDEAARPAVRIA